MEKFHGFVVEESLGDPKALEQFEILGRKSLGDKTLVKIELKPWDIRNELRRLQSFLGKGYFFHAYRDNNLIVVFNDRQCSSSTFTKVFMRSVMVPGKSM